MNTFELCCKWCRLASMELDNPFKQVEFFNLTYQLKKELGIL